MELPHITYSSVISNPLILYLFIYISSLVSLSPQYQIVEQCIGERPWKIIKDNDGFPYFLISLQGIALVLDGKDAKIRTFFCCCCYHFHPVGEADEQHTGTVCHAKEVNLRKNKASGWNEEGVWRGDIEIGKGEEGGQGLEKGMWGIETRIIEYNICGQKPFFVFDL